MKKIVTLFIGVLCFVNNSYAALTDVGGNLVNDSTQNITWLQDGNLMGTLCGDGLGSGDALFNSWQASANPPVDEPAVIICNTNNGRMTWNDAQAWIAHLNANNYLGYNDWRQPSTTQPDATCSSQDVNPTPDQGFGYGCTGSELGHLFNVSEPSGLGNPNDLDDGCNASDPPNTPAPSGCFQKVGPFNNAYVYAYWSGTEYAPNTTRAWHFNTSFGNQNRLLKTNFYFYVWPVRDGLLVTGACGTADSVLTSSIPSSNLCSTGSATAITPSAGEYTWSCNGSGGGTNASCAAPRGYVVTASASSGGTITPSGVQTIEYNTTTLFNIVPNTGFSSSVAGTCGGLLTEPTYTTNAITADCSVSANFTAIPVASPQAVPTISLWGLGILVGLIGFISFRRGIK